MNRIIGVLMALVLAMGVVATAVAAGPTTYVAVLSGAAERPNPVDTPARGVAIFQLNADGTELSYRLIASNIENVVASHIHIGGVEAAGPVTAFLFSGPASGRIDGVLATGTITTADLIGPLAGQTLADLIDEIEAGNAYVNVHTNDGVAPPNTGPGDFPGGEIRGQISLRGI